MSQEIAVRPFDLNKKTIAKLARYGESNDIEAVVQTLVAEYPQTSISELCRRTGLHRLSLLGIFDKLGVPYAGQDERIQMMREQHIGIFGLTPEERSANGVVSGNRTVELQAGYHSLTPEEKSKNGKKGGSKGGKISRDSRTGIFALTPEQRAYNSSLGGISVHERGRGVFSLSEEEQSENGRIGGTIALQQRLGVHALSSEEHMANGIKASEALSSQKTLYEGEVFDSREEAATASILQQFIPGFTLERGANFQVIIPEAQKKVDFIVNNKVVEYNPIIMLHTNTNFGAFESQEEYDTYVNYLSQLDDTQKTEYKLQVTETLKRRYYNKRRDALDTNPEFKNKELVVLVNAYELYDFIAQQGNPYQGTPQEFNRMFNRLVKKISKEQRQESI